MPGEFLTLNDLKLPSLPDYQPAKVYYYRRDKDICVWYTRVKEGKQLKGGEAE